MGRVIKVYSSGCYNRPNVVRSYVKLLIRKVIKDTKTGESHRGMRVGL